MDLRKLGLCVLSAVALAACSQQPAPPAGGSTVVTSVIVSVPARETVTVTAQRTSVTPEEGDANDQAFMAVLVQHDINVGSRDQSIALGHRVCEWFEERPGNDLAAAVKGIVQNYPKISQDQAALLAGAAGRAYCPDTPIR
ncbi:DUF732 domain-containing protein [Mycobacteroides abscessus]|uniref:Protein of uncharacterized function (DUF732) n=1 Tax=Mycobacteroides abscessus subsp. massiliense TaxID=1962118 RepID=A0A1T8KSC6_9MYCO|nr:DUF732 domain-containing protein [Mycobacteroides abscessus]SKL85384.1 Protein of uncharacterised function (DUF732) [Mycobacteroides abscessus subsp. massiliense]SKS90344.1 Protein of uncharacterised function (DUF732) [Mycobacteroides abscessus subsp. massiliense]SKT21042.1 Protein of uncharacterised function (DUF732) [Mycobacteroides abscessus subsp. massiliense]SKW83752.1 Protein of uncharacterised function (DUF732) [Mycobacteroides abscessus subsp. massiliense]